MHHGTSQHETRRHIAVIGAGVSGLTAAYVLQRAAEVTLFEADDRLGGHAHTHEVGLDDGVVNVDSGFIVHNRQTYPHLLRLFDELGVATQETEMSMSIRCHGCRLEYAGGKGPQGLFAQRTAVLRPAYLALLARVPRLHRQARALLDTDEDCTLGEFLARGRYSRYFVQHFVVPLVSAVWSCGPHQVMAYPARYLFTFLAHHGMLTVTGSPVWRTVVGGSHRYVEAAAKELSAVRTATPVRSVRRTATGAAVRDDADTVTDFDAVVLATHADQALTLLEEPDPVQRAVLGAFEYSPNDTVLHADSSVLPHRAGARASWNYVLPSCQPGPGEVQVSYDMNRLQRLDTASPLVVTLNGAARVRPETVIARMRYEHPIYTPAVLAAQQRLPELNDGVLAFAGAYHGWGFHEDGCRSGVEAAASLGVAW